jgi:hypothetical protein
MEHYKGSGRFKSFDKEQVCVFVSQKLPIASGMGQTCFLLPLVAKRY